MPKEENKPKEHMLSGFFDKCRDMVEPQDNNIAHKEENISGEIAKLKLKKIREILNA
jgi:hypothetical protein